MEIFLNYYLTGNGLPGKGARWLCPFHEDKNPSMSINPKTGKAHCFSCEKDFDALDIIQKVKGEDFKTAKEIYLTFTGNPANISLKPTQTPKHTNDRPKVSAEQKTQNTAVYMALLKMLSLTKSGINYLLGRGISKQTVDKWQIKSIDNPGQVFSDLLKQFSKEVLTTAGLINSKGYFIFSLQCVLLPVLVKDTPVYLTARNIGKDAPFKAVCLNGIEKPLFIGNRENKDFLIFEGIPDALSYYELTGKDNFIACLGLPTPEKLKPFYIDNKRLISALDNDIAGIKAIERIQTAGFDFPKFNYSGYLQSILDNNFAGGLDLIAKDFNDILKIKKSLTGNKEVLNSLFISLSATQREDFEERTAIMIHDSNLTENNAKTYALLRVCYGKR